MGKNDYRASIKKLSTIEADTPPSLLLQLDKKYHQAKLCNTTKTHISNP